MALKEKTWEIIDKIGTIAETSEGYTKDLVLIKWYNKPPIYEVRTFAPDGTPKKRPGLLHDELVKLRDLLNGMQL